MTRILYVFAIAIIFALMKLTLQSDNKIKKEHVNTSFKTTTRKEDLCTNIEYTHTMLIEKFFVDALNIFKEIKPACICVQLCKDKPTYCYPNGCIYEVKKYIPKDDDDVEKTTNNSNTTLTTDADTAGIMTSTIVASSPNLEYSIFPDTTEDIEAIYIRQLMKPSETTSTQVKEDCHSSTTPTTITVSRPLTTQTKFSLWSKINQKRLPHPYVGPHFHTPGETLIATAEISTMTTKTQKVPQKIISEKTHWPSNDSLQTHSHKTYGEDHKENWLYEIFDETYKSTLAHSDDYDTVLDNEGDDKFHDSVIANLQNEEIVNEYFDKNNNDKSTTGVNNDLRLAIPDFLDDYNIDDKRNENNFSVTPDVPIIKGKVTNRWGSELDYSYDYTDNGTSKDPLNDVIIHSYSEDAFSERYTEPLYKGRETYSFYNTTDKIYPNTISMTEQKRLKLDRQSQVQNFSPFLADRNNYIKRKTNNETIYVVKPDLIHDADDLSTRHRSRSRLPSAPYSTMYGDVDSEEDEFRVSRKYTPITRDKPKQLKRRRQGDIFQRNKLETKKTYHNSDNTENNANKPAERKAIVRYETNSPNKRIMTYTSPDISENLQGNKYRERNKKKSKHSNNVPFTRLRRRDNSNLRPAEYTNRKRREKSFRNSRKLSDEVSATTSVYNRRNSRDLKRNLEGIRSKKGFQNNRRMAQRIRFNRIKQVG